MNMSANNSEKSIGNIIAAANNLSSDQINQVIDYQRENGVKFGEAAVNLGFVKREDVLWALSQQFHYPYQGGGNDSVSEELVAATNPFDAASEFFRDVRSQLIESVLTGERTALAVCSTETGDGKSYFAANLAVAFSQLGARTLLVDADMRTPRQHDIFGIKTAHIGLSGILSGRQETNVIKPIEALPSLYVMPVGVTPPNPLELIQQPTFDLLLTELLKKFDYVVVDTPAASHGADARLIAAKCGASLAIARKGITKIKPLDQWIASVAKGKHKFAGVIMNEHL
jgi:protein-tyrosine kinase